VIYVSRPIMNQKKLKVEVIRPTDLLDPVKWNPSRLNPNWWPNEEIQVRCELDERVLVTT
jgi:excinuclease UvrABC helicase subunit UvrB